VGVDEEQPGSFGHGHRPEHTAVADLSAVRQARVPGRRRQIANVGGA
jgi:hypothetical protein